MAGTRICKICRIKKSIEEFYFRKDSQKYYTQCRACGAIQNKKYYQANREKCKAMNLKYYRANKERFSENNKNYRNVNRDKIRVYKREYEKFRHNNDPCHKLRGSVSKTVRDALKASGSSKNGNSVLNYLPYTISGLRTHLESQFEPWMTWNNWGRFDPNLWDDNDSSTWTWQVDHIIPQSKLPYDSMQHSNFLRCWSLKNLRPLSAKQNNLKRDST